MNDLQSLDKKREKLSLYRNFKSNKKPKNMPQGLKSILITNSNGLEISSHLGNFLHFSKKNMLDENYSFKRITTNCNKNTSYPVNTASNIQNIKQRDGPFINLKSNLYKKKFEKFLTNSKKNDATKNLNSKDRVNSNINIMNNITGLMLNRSNLKLNIIPKKTNYKYIHFRENNLSINSNKNIGKSTSISKSKSKSKNRRENKSYNNNIAQMFFNKYLKIKFDNRKKSRKKSLNYLNKESPRYINNKFSNEINISDINKINSFNLIKNIQFKGVRKKNKSSNLLISHINNINNINSKSKNSNHPKGNSNNIIISKIEINRPNFKNAKVTHKNNIVINNNIITNSNNTKTTQNEKSGKKYLSKNHIMYMVNKKNSGKNKHQKKPITNNKNKNISLKETKNESNINTNINSKNNNCNNCINLNKYNTNKNDNINNIINNKPRIETNENVIYDYKTNKKYKNTDNDIFKEKNNKIIFNKKENKLINNTNTNPNVNEIENSVNTYKILNERLKTEYNDISLEAIDKMYEQDTDDLNINNKNNRSKKNSEENSFRFFYPDGDIYNRDDEFFIENNDENENIDNNEKREKELDETESPIKMDTDKVTVENSGVLSFDQVKDIICYYNMNNTDKQSEFLFQNKEREKFDMNYKNKYLNFFFGNKENEIGNDFGILKENNNNDLTDDMISINTFNLKYPNNSIFSMDTEYSSKMKKKNNKNLVKNI